MRKIGQISLDLANSGIGGVKFGLFGYRYKGPDAQRWPAPKKDGLCDLPMYQVGQMFARLEGRFEQFDLISSVYQSLATRNRFKGPNVT